MSNPHPKPVQEPIEIWVMTTKDGVSDVNHAPMSVGGSTRNVDKYYHRMVRIRGVIHHIRGRFELLIHSPQERDCIDERLNAPPSYHRQRVDARRVTSEELEAINMLESDPKNWKNIGGMTIFCQPTEEDVPDYPPNPSNPPKDAIQAPHGKEHIEAAITDMQNEGGPPNPHES